MRILVIRYRFIGDTILTVPFLRNLRYAYPEAKIDVLVGPQSGQVLAGCAYIDDLLEFDTTRFHKYDRGDNKKKNFFHYAIQLRKRDYDVVFVLKRSISSAFLAWLTGAKERIGYRTNGSQLFLTKSTPWCKDKHEVESTLDLLTCAGLPIKDKHLEAWISKKEQAEINDLVPEVTKLNKYVLIHAAATTPDKVYPLDKWAAVVRDLHNEHQFVPVFTGSRLDHKLYELLQTRADVPCLNFAGRLNLRQSMALYQQMDLAICVDSGPAHLCAAVGTPTLSIFGPTDPNRWRPWGEKHDVIYDTELSCRPCHYIKTCDDRPCLTKLDPQLVLAKALSIYERTKVSSPA